MSRVRLELEIHSLGINRGCDGTYWKIVFTSANLAANYVPGVRRIRRRIK